MSKSKKAQAVDAGVLAAEEALRRAKVARDEAKEALRTAEQAVQDAAAELSAARVRADANLSRAEICAIPWGSRRTMRHEAVIVRRTAATIVARYPGQGDEYAFRKDRRGVWRLWPSRGDDYWLELPEGQL